MGAAASTAAGGGGGSGGGVVAANGGGAPPAVGCRGGGGESFELKVGMLKETPLGKVLSEADLAYFSSFFTVETLPPHCRVPTGAGELLVVGEGEVQVYVAQAGLDAKTGEQSLVLCTKRRGDLIWVPSVTRLAKQKSGVGLDEDDCGASGAAGGARDALPLPVCATPPFKHKELYTLMDTTFIDSLFGATLLKLDRRKYDELTRGVGLPDEAAAQLDLKTIRRVIDCNMEDYLRKVPLFRQIPPAKLAVLGEMCNYEFIKAGQRVCSEGEAGNEIYIVLDGHLAVSTRSSPTTKATAGGGGGDGSGDAGGSLRLATLGPGDYFGELAALIRIKRIATVVAEDHTLLASIKRHDFRSFMTIMPDLRAAMDKVVKEHLLYKYAKVGSRFFPPAPQPPAVSSSSPASPKQRQTPPQPPALPSIYALCEVEDVDPERILIYEGDEPSGIYFVSEGQVRVVRRGAGAREAVLGPGSLLGARAAVLGEPERFTVVTDQVCVLLRFGAEAARQHLEENPAVKASLELLFKGRATPLATLLACPEGYAAFAAHLKEEFTLEHLSFYDDTRAFQQQLLLADAADAAAAISKLQHIHATYLAPTAPSPVNIPDKMRQRFLTAYDQASQGDDAQAVTAVVAPALETVKREVLALLERDNYARFKNTEAFAGVLAALKALLPTEPLPAASAGTSA